jgi:hypothetical protein
MTVKSLNGVTNIVTGHSLDSSCTLDEGMDDREEKKREQ